MSSTLPFTLIEDSELSILIEEELTEDQKTLENLKLQTYLSGEYDKNNCIMEIHSGAGGTEACDWANMLLRMYQRYFEKKHYKVEQLGLKRGIKNVQIQ